MKCFNVLFILGAVIGTVVCSMLNIEEPTGLQDPRPPEENPRFTPYPRPNNTNRNNKNKVNKSKSIILYLNVLLIFIINAICFCL